MFACKLILPFSDTDNQKCCRNLRSKTPASLTFLEKTGQILSQCYATYSILCIEKSGQWQLCEKGQEQRTKESQFSLSPILISSSSIYLAHFPLAFLDRFFALICANLCPQRKDKPNHTTQDIKNKQEKLKVKGQAIVDTPLLIQSQVDNVKKILGALWNLPAKQHSRSCQAN